MSVPVVLVHGGAGDIPDSRVEPRKVGTQLAVREGYRVLMNGGSALDAVQAAVRVMEDDPVFNAGTYLMSHFLSLLWLSSEVIICFERLGYL